jgi:MinD-like ATPase involved in chromosome partitioning or flagellar assembly
VASQRNSSAPGSGNTADVTGSTTPSKKDRTSKTLKTPKTSKAQPRSLREPASTVASRAQKAREAAAGDPTDIADESDTRLASALPGSFNVPIDLPVTAHSAPEHELAVSIENVTFNPADLAPGEAIATTTIDLMTEHIVPRSSTISLPGETNTAQEASARPGGELKVTSSSSVAPVVAESASMLTADRLIDSKKRRRPAPEGTWPAFVYAATLHVVNLGDSFKVRERKELDARIARKFEGSSRFIPILTRKGGVGKTTITTLIGMAMADVREDRVIAIDANPDRGTLAERVNKQTNATVRDVVIRASSINDFTQFSTLVSRDGTRLDVLASDTDPMLSEAFDEDDYNVVADMAARFYDIVLTDCGTGIVHSVMKATLQRADAVVIVSGGSVDEARLASETLTWLEANGYAHLVSNAVVALNTATQGTNLVKLEEIEAHLQSRVREIVRIPYDAQLAAGSVIDFKSLRPLTKNAARDLAALVADGLPQSRAR